MTDLPAAIHAIVNRVGEAGVSRGLVIDRLVADGAPVAAVSAAIDTEVAEGRLTAAGGDRGRLYPLIGDDLFCIRIPLDG